MEEQTNQTVESTPETSSDDWNLFEDAELDTPEETAETNETDDTPQPTSFMTIKYNGEDKALSQEEAITMAQKGMNYDKVYGELQNYKQHFKNSNDLKILVEMANSAGVGVSEYLVKMQSFQNDAAIQNIADKLKEKYPEAPEELLKEMAKNQFERTNADKRQAELDVQKSQESAELAALGKQIEALQSEYPDVDILKLPEEVIAMAQSGETLLSAYRAYDLKQWKDKFNNLNTELEATKKNQSNRQKSTGSLAGKAANDAMDPFLEGLNS